MENLQVEFFHKRNMRRRIPLSEENYKKIEGATRLITLFLCLSFFIPFGFSVARLEYVVGSLVNFWGTLNSITGTSLAYLFCTELGLKVYEAFEPNYKAVETPPIEYRSRK
jgi:hypothetical protein